MVAVAFGDQDVRRDGTPCGMVHGEDRRVRRRARHHRSVDQVGGEGDHCAVDGAHARTAGEIRGEDRARERNVGNGLPQRVGDDGRLDPAGERIAVARVLAQLEPAGAAHRLGEAPAPRAVVEIGHGTRSELASQTAGGPPQLGLFGRVAGIHGARIILVIKRESDCKSPIASYHRPAPVPARVRCCENTATTP